MTMMISMLVFVTAMHCCVRAALYNSLYNSSYIQFSLQFRAALSIRAGKKTPEDRLPVKMIPVGRRPSPYGRGSIKPAKPSRITRQEMLVPLW